VATRYKRLQMTSNLSLLPVGPNIPSPWLLTLVNSILGASISKDSWECATTITEANLLSSIRSIQIRNRIRSHRLRACPPPCTSKEELKGQRAANLKATVFAILMDKSTTEAARVDSSAKLL
jgi:hypothetical protein